MKTDKKKRIKSMIKPRKPVMCIYENEKECWIDNGESMPLKKAKKLFPDSLFIKLYPGDMSL